MAEAEQPQGELVIQTIAMPKDTNRDGDIFGGWIVSQMDLGSAILAGKIAKSRVVTVARGRHCGLLRVAGKNRAHVDANLHRCLGDALSHGRTRESHERRVYLRCARR